MCFTDYSYPSCTSRLWDYQSRHFESQLYNNPDRKMTIRHSLLPEMFIVHTLAIANVPHIAYKIYICHTLQSRQPTVFSHRYLSKMLRIPVPEPKVDIDSIKLMQTICFLPSTRTLFFSKTSFHYLVP